MKKTILFTMSLMAAFLLCVSTLTSCSKDETYNNVTTYALGMSKLSESGTESSKIYAAYDQALNITTSSFEWPGGVDDNAVKTAAAKAETTLKDVSFTGSFTIEITRGTAVIYTHHYGN